MAKCVWTWLHQPIKLLKNANFLPCTDKSHDDFMFTLICALGLLFTNTAAIKIIIKHVPWWLLNCFHHILFQFRNYKMFIISCSKNNQIAFRLQMINVAANYYYYCNYWFGSHKRPCLQMCSPEVQTHIHLLWF